MEMWTPMGLNWCRQARLGKRSHLRCSARRIARARGAQELRRSSRVRRRRRVAEHTRDAELIPAVLRSLRRADSAAGTHSEADVGSGTRQPQVACTFSPDVFYSAAVRQRLCGDDVQAEIDSVAVAFVASRAQVKLTAPGVEPGLSRPRRDILTTRRCGP